MLGIVLYYIIAITQSKNNHIFYKGSDGIGRHE